MDQVSFSWTLSDAAVGWPGCTVADRIIQAGE
jgi:hypothetical protein